VVELSFLSVKISAGFLFSLSSKSPFSPNNSSKRGLLERFQLKEFESLVAALRDGDFRLYQQELDRYQDEFIARGVYIILEKLKLFVYRNFFKKMSVHGDGEREGGREGGPAREEGLLLLEACN